MPTASTYADEMSKMFCSALAKNEEAVAALEHRGVTKAMIEGGNVGLCPPFMAVRTPLLKGRFVVPIKNASGSIIAFAGRQYDPMSDLAEKSLWDTYSYDPAKAAQAVEKWKRGKWINESFPKRLHLYNLDLAKHHAREKGYIVVVEGYFDALVLASHALPNTVASCGVALTSNHIALIARYCSSVVMLLDPDEAGDRAAQDIAPRLREANLRCHRVILPQGYDPDEFVLKVGGKKLARVIDNMVRDNEPERRIEIIEQRA